MSCLFLIALNLAPSLDFPGHEPLLDVKHHSAQLAQQRRRDVGGCIFNNIDVSRLGDCQVHVFHHCEPRPWHGTASLAPGIPRDGSYSVPMVEQALGQEASRLFGYMGQARPLASCHAGNRGTASQRQRKQRRWRTRLCRLIVVWSCALLAADSGWGKMSGQGLKAMTSLSFRKPPTWDSRWNRDEPSAGTALGPFLSGGYDRSLHVV